MFDLIFVRQKDTFICADCGQMALLSYECAEGKIYLKCPRCHDGWYSWECAPKLCCFYAKTKRCKYR